MIVVDRSALLEHKAADMYALVDNVESYPRFLPWCSGAQVGARNGTRSLATIHISFGGIRQHFSTDNTSEPVTSITMKLVSGPFRRLQGYWRFKPLGEQACKVEFHLEYEIASRILERAVGPVFQHIANTLMDAFARRADDVYGKR
ncbi:MAG: type II toxin-antitoxin system RatA family toxin [Betaproteobacteria bacterium]|nr:type II toxin-antitoxin system RatA family toxin [Betaproteobacteria bacterium]